MPIEIFDGLRASLFNDRSQTYRDFASSFYGANRPGAKVSQGVLDQFWLWSMSGLKNAYESIKAFSETDFTEDLKQFDVPTLVLHGEDDQVVPVRNSAQKSARLIRGAKEILLPGRAARHHGHAPGSGQRRAPRVPAQLPGNVTARRPHDGRGLGRRLNGTLTMKIVIIAGPRGVIIRRVLR